MLYEGFLILNVVKELNQNLKFLKILKVCIEPFFR